MAFPLSWEENPPEIPPKGQAASASLRQFAGWLRDKFERGVLEERYFDWLYDYESAHPAPGGVTSFLKMSEEKTKRTIEAVQKSKPLPEAAALAAAEGNRADYLMNSMGDAIRELRQGFSTAIKELANGYQNTLSELRVGFGELRQGYSQLNSDHRSLLGLIFPHTEAQHKIANESMVTYREALTMEAKANVALMTQKVGVNAMEQQAEAMVLSLVSDTMRAKMGLPQKSEPPKEEKKAAPKEESPASPASGAIADKAAELFWEQIQKKMSPAPPAPPSEGE